MMAPGLGARVPFVLGHAVALTVVGQILLMAGAGGFVLPVRHASGVIVAHHLASGRRPTVHYWYA